MTTEQINEQISAIHTLTKQLLRSKESSIEFLVQAGIINANDGKALKYKFAKEKNPKLLAEPKSSYKPFKASRKDQGGKNN